MSEVMENMSALDANIKEKGQNSYYFAHSLKINGPQWDGKEEPRLLHIDESPKPSSSGKVNVPFDSYAWVDSDKNVKLYIDFENADTVQTEAISLETTERSIKFSVKVNETKNMQLFIDDLNGDIDSATYKVKSNQFIIILKKKGDESWYKLRKSNT